MEQSLARNWWVLALRGTLAIVFGVLVLLWPVLGWLAVVGTFGVYALLDGVVALGTALGGGNRRRWWGLLLEGAFGVAAGVLTFAWPELTALALLYFIAGWAVASGVAKIVAAATLREEISGEWLLGLSGVLSIVFGVALALMPGPGALALAWLIAANSVAYGVLMLVLAFRLWGLASEAPRAAGAEG